MTAGAVFAVLISAVWGAFGNAPATTTAKAVDVERADPQPVSGWSVPSFSDIMTSAQTWSSPTIASIEAMGGD